MPEAGAPPLRRLPERRLHASLLFYGFDEGTWSDPPIAAPPGPRLQSWVGHCPGGPGGHCKQARAEDVAPLESIKAVWGGDAQDECGLRDADEAVRAVVAATLAAVAEPSTDDGSDLKGSESDSLPDSTVEGYYLPSPTSEAAAALAYMQFDPAAAVYSPYLQPDDCVALQGFGLAGEQVGAPFPYEGYAAAAATAAAAGIPSIGSYAHLSGQCSRCCFFPKGRCANGYACQFCHFDHDKRPRNGKKKRHLVHLV